MAVRKRKDGCPLEISHIREDPRILIERNEILRLTKMAKSWEFTCSFCFKKFPSAQAMGGHQNAHRSERLEEKRLFVRDPIGYRKRAYLRSMKAESSTVGGGSNNSLNLHAPTMVKNDPPKPINLLGHGFGAFNASANGNNHFCQQSTSKDSPVVDINGENLKALPFVVMNFLPPKELSLADGVGTVHAEDAKGKKCIEFSIGGYDQINLDHKLDLTLKL
ncbi:hypothetical protein CDL12_20264 [Handroanthus impetiginosus]|uniref:C2H2-type domain-containing protein n=1 Tax=Handroanthus impetiginosus TaxID=429701 RepID=A0A2G9GPG9_9LAMI|nr:hypothetical protein CDL12_20264 [Handroanthus impetiginosus]